MSDLVVEQLVKQYPTPTTPLVILNEITLALSLGENLAIVGPSGSGKSTLLQIIGTLDRPTSGQLRLLGETPFSLSEAELAKFRNRRIGFVFQDHYLLPQLTALENVLIPRLADGPAEADAVQQAEALLDRVGLGERKYHRPAELSGGERQRVAIARALVNQPQLLLADEPTGNLDPTTAGEMADLLFELQQGAEPPTMMIVVTHSDVLARRLQRCLRLERGQLVPVN